MDTDEAFAEVLSALAGVPAVALDTEFHRERTYFPKLALLQLAWYPDKLVLVDPLAVDVTPLAGLMESDTTIVIHAASQDLEVLRLTTHSVPRNLFDTQIAAGFLGFSTPALAALHTDLLDVHLNKSDRLTDWLKRPLGESVLDYAADDVRYLLEIHERLVHDLADRDRLDWALAECELERVHALDERDPADAWRRAKEARRLTGRAAGVARAVAAWRERRAAELDVPVRRVLSDLALVGIAQRPPHSVRQLHGVRGVDSRSLGDAAANGLLDAIAHGEAAGKPPPTDRPEPKVERALRPAVTLLSSWLSQFAKEVRIDTQLLATRRDIEGFVTGSEASRLASGWRHELVGRPMQQLLDGKAALAFEPERGIILESRVTGDRGAPRPGETSG